MKKQHRRDFLRQASTGLIAGISLADLAEAAPFPTAPGNPTDENFWNKLRNEFPLNKNLLYLNSATLGPSPKKVIEAINQSTSMVDETMNYGGAEGVVTKIARFVGAREDEIALTHNTTEGINIACWGLPLQKEDEVIITTREHAGNALPWLNRQRRDGIVLKTFTPASTAAQTLERILSLLTKKTKVIAIPHITCTEGHVLPIKEISQIGKAYGVFVFVDGAHGPGMLPLNLLALGCDAYAGCFHKWMLGPKGTGFLYVSNAAQEKLQPVFVGAGSDDAKWNMAVEPPVMGAYANSAHRYYGGSLNLALSKGVEAAIDFMDNLDMQNVQLRIKTLSRYLQEQLIRRSDKIELLTPVEEESFGGIQAFRIKSTPYDVFYRLALEQKIRIRMVPENGVNCVRVSTHIYNSRQEIDRLLALIK